ncbi:MAG TPA: hypothetical protein VG755_01900 [Nannocystaceae bacterium]|nr:hypothetical protein [Nannocystaceae bacterium]
MKTIVALFDELRRAERALRCLIDDEVRPELCSLVAAAAEKDVDPRSSDGESMSGVFRARSGAAASLAQLLPDLAVVESADVGTVLASGPVLAPADGESIAGGLHDGLVTAGVPAEDARRYVERVQRGGALVVVVASPRHVDRVTEVLAACEPVALDPAT